MRLQRIGKRGQAYFRIIVTEHTKKPQGEYLELLGSYDPHKKNLLAKKERIDYWISKGVQLSPTVNNLLVNNKIIIAPKMVSWKPKVVTKAPVAPTVKAEQATPIEEVVAESPVETPVEPAASADLVPPTASAVEQSSGEPKDENNQDQSQ